MSSVPHNVPAQEQSIESGENGDASAAQDGDGSAAADAATIQNEGEASAAQTAKSAKK